MDSECTGVLCGFSDMELFLRSVRDTYSRLEDGVFYNLFLHKSSSCRRLESGNRQVPDTRVAIHLLRLTSYTQLQMIIFHGLCLSIASRDSCSSLDFVHFRLGLRCFVWRGRF